VLHALYDRSHFDENEYKALILPMYQAENVLLLRTLYVWSTVNAQDIHSPKYAISKKFSEVSQSRPGERSDTRHLAGQLNK
jgi:exportin-5